MINKRLFKFISIFLLVTLVLFLNVNTVSAVNWYRGSTHQHTGFSTGLGYDEKFDPFDPNTWVDGCSILLEGHPFEGKNVTSLKQSALNKGLSWLTFTDHSYCLDKDEFKTVQQDCDNVKNQNGFTCLSGEELSVREEKGGMKDE